MNTIIEITNLKKSFKVVERRSGIKGAFADIFSRKYQEVHAVNNISLHIGEGEIVGFLGANGAGKSTTIKMMTGILNPSGGKIYVDRKIPSKNRSENNQKIGVVFGQRSQLWWNLPLIESFEILKDIYQIHQEIFDQNLSLFCKLVPLEPLLKKTIRQMSLGQRMLSDIVAAFLHNPKVVFLDEPTIGLDINVKNQIRHLIQELNKTKNTTVILTSHDIGDIEALCSRAIVIDKGTVIFDDLVDKLNKLFGSIKTLRIGFKNINEVFFIEVKKRLLREFIELLENDIICDGSWINITVDEQKNSTIHILNYMLKSYDVSDILIEDMKIETVISKIYAGGIG